MFLLEQALVVVGLPCAGKTTAGLLVEEALGYPHYEASDVMQAHFSASASQDGNIDEFATQMLTDMPRLVPEGVVHAARTAGFGRIVISGLRSPQELRILGLLVRNVRAVFVHAAFDVRYARAVQRRRADAPPSVASFRARDTIQRCMGVRELQRTPSVTRISNTGTLDTYRATLLTEVDRWSREP